MNKTFEIRGAGREPYGFGVYLKTNFQWEHLKDFDTLAEAKEYLNEQVN